MTTWQVIQGDSLDELRRLPDASVDAVITDPPYSSGGAFRGDRSASSRAKYVQSDAMHDLPAFTGDNRDQRGYLAWCSLWLGQCFRASVDGGICCVFTDWRQLPVTTDALQAAGWVWRGIAVWDKLNGRPCLGRFSSRAEYVVWGTKGARAVFGGCAPGVYSEATPRTGRVHITQKPVGVIDWLLKVTRGGSTVLDPFCGSGTAGVACVQTGRNFIGIEIDPHYCEVARKRIAKAAEDAAEPLLEQSA